MADYSRYRTETLEKMFDTANEKYYQEVMKPVGNWGDGMRLSKLPRCAAYERARARVEEIGKELARRRESDRN